MNAKQIVIEISENGECSINGENFSGPECSKFIGEIQSSIGQIKSSTKKPEYNATNITKQQNKIRN